jgi:hypothetical protein
VLTPTYVSQAKATADKQAAIAGGRLAVVMIKLRGAFTNSAATAAPKQYLSDQHTKRCTKCGHLAELSAPVF